MNSLADVATALQQSRNLVVSGHIMPDGDSIGSTLALGLALEKLGKKVTMICSEPVPETYQFLPGADRIQQELPPSDYDTLVMVDCSVQERLAKQLHGLLKDGITVINIDHHVSTDTFADINYINSHAAATGEIIYDLLVNMGIDIDQPIALNLYTAIVTDTGSFRYESTTPATHRRVADLLDKGIQVGQVSKLIFDEKPIETINILKTVLPTLSISPCGKVAWISLDWATKEKLQAKDEHTENLINYPRQIKGVEVALFFKALSRETVKVSLRSNHYVDVNKLAGNFGGGGHKRAAGCQIQGDFADIKDAVIAKALEAVRKES